MNSAIEVKDTPTEDLPLDEDYLGVNFNIEAADEAENGTPSVYLESIAPEDLQGVGEENREVVPEETYCSANLDTVLPSVVNGIDKSPALPVESKKKRPYQRRSSVKAADIFEQQPQPQQQPPGSPPPSQHPVVKLHKLSPGTIAKHTVREIENNGEVEVAPSPTSKKRNNVNGPGLLRQNKHIKKKIARPPRTGVGRKWDNVRVKEEKPENEKCIPISSGNELTEELVECMRCSSVVSLSTARQHLTVCIPITPVKENDKSPGLPSSSPTASGVPGATPAGGSSGRGYSTRASSIRSVQSTYGPDACGLCGARGLSDGLARYLHTHLHHQRFSCIICGSMHSKVSALVKHLQAVHGKEDRFYQGPDVGAQLSQVLGRASILVCTECGIAIHVLDVEAHSLNCKATPRFPLPSQVGYHADSQQQQPLAITYPMPSPGGGSSAAAATSAGVPSSAESQGKFQRRRFRSKIKKEPLSDYPALPEGYQLTEPKTEPDLAAQTKSENLMAAIDAVASAGAEDEAFMSPTEDESMVNHTADDHLDGSDQAVGMDSEGSKGVRKKPRVMLPTHGSPGRGLRTLLPGNRGPPPSPPKRTRGPGLVRTLPVGGAPGLASTEPKNLLCGAEEEVDEEPDNLDESTGTSADRTEEPMAATREASPAPQLPPRDKKDWKSTLEPLLYKLLLRVKKALRRIQLLHCPVCIRYETHEATLEEICQHLRVAHNNHLLRGLGEDTHNRLFAEINSIYMEDVSNEEAEEYVDSTSCRKVLLKFCVEPLDKTYSCDLCNVNDLSVKEMVQHLRGAHGFRMYPCLECGQQFKTYGYFISHLVSTGKESIYGCRLCGIVGMVSLYMLQSHLRTHSLCDICHTCFESQTALRKHMFNHQQDSPYACTVCQVSYKNYESLEMHLLWKHGTESKPCPTCQEKTWLCTYHFCPGAPANLAEVVDNPCVCTVCRLEFSKASMLKVHTRLHTGERPHKCTSCKKSFISKKLLAKHTAMKHSEAAISQAAVAQAAANEIKSALEKSGLKPKKVQQELLKLIGQQNAAKRSTSAAPSAAPSRRVSTEDGVDQQVQAKGESSQDSSDVKTPDGLGDSGPQEIDSTKPKEEAALKNEEPAPPATSHPTLVPQLSRIGSSIFDIEDDDEPPPPMTTQMEDRDQDSAIGASPVGGAKDEGDVDKQPETESSEVQSEVNNIEATTGSQGNLDSSLGSEDQKATNEEAGSGGESRTDENLLDLLASAATSKQAEIPAPLQPPPTPPPLPPPPPPEPVIPPALKDHDYCTFGEPPADKIKPKSPRKTRRHSKKHRAKKEPRFVLDLSSSSSDEEGDGPGNVNGKPKKTNRPFNFGKVSQLSDSESSYCDSNCSCSGSGSSSSSSSSSSSGSSSDDSSSSSSSSDSEDDNEVASPAAKGASSAAATSASTAAEKGGEDEMDVDVENNSNEPSSPESSSDSENEEVESDADVSVHESDLETSDSDSENKKRLRTSPNRSANKKRKKKKKKKRRAFKDSSLLIDDQSKGTGITDGLRLPVSSSSVDDIINAVASGHFRGASKNSKGATKVRNEPAPLADISDRSVAVNVGLGPSAGGAGVSVGGSGGSGKRGRGKRKRSDDMYWYEDDNIDNVTNASKKKKLKVAGATPTGRTTAKLKLTHKYDTFQRSGASAAKAAASSSSSFTGKPLSAPPNPFEDPDRLYCYCRCPYDEVSQMIGCDANDCPYEWFHFECVGISEAPEGQWYCPECRLRPKYRAQFDEPFFQPPPPPQQII